MAGTAFGVVAVLAFSRNRLTVAVHAAVAAAGARRVILAIRSAPAIAHATGSTGAAVASSRRSCSRAARARRPPLPRGCWGSTDESLPRSAARRSVPGLLAVVLPAIALGPRELSKAWHSFSHPAVTRSSDPAARLVNLSGSRYLVWKSALQAFSHHPSTGTGAGTFAFWWNRTRPTTSSSTTPTTSGCRTSPNSVCPARS